MKRLTGFPPGFDPDAPDDRPKRTFKRKAKQVKKVKRKPPSPWRTPAAPADVAAPADDVAAPAEPSPAEPSPTDAVMSANPKPNTSGKLRVRRPLVRRPPEAKIKRFLASAKKWRPGQSGNPAGARSRKGKLITDYRSFVETCRGMTPRALERLREALELPWSRETSRTILTASALTIERAFGRAVQVQIDATPPQVAPVVVMTDEYWEGLVGALRESGALDKKLVDAPDSDEGEIVDAEVIVEEQLKLDPPKT